MARLLLSHRLPSFLSLRPSFFRSFSSSPTLSSLPNSPLNDGEKEFAWNLANRYPDPISKKDVEIGLQTAMKIHGGIWDSSSMSLMRGLLTYDGWVVPVKEVEGGEGGEEAVVSFPSMDGGRTFSLFSSEERLGDWKDFGEDTAINPTPLPPQHIPKTLLQLTRDDLPLAQRTTMLAFNPNNNTPYLSLILQNHTIHLLARLGWGAHLSHSLRKGVLEGSEGEKGAKKAVFDLMNKIETNDCWYILESPKGFATDTFNTSTPFVLVFTSPDIAARYGEDNLNDECDVKPVEASNLREANGQTPLSCVYGYEGKEKVESINLEAGDLAGIAEET